MNLLNLAFCEINVSVRKVAGNLCVKVTVSDYINLKISRQIYAVVLKRDVFVNGRSIDFENNLLALCKEEISGMSCRNLLNGSGLVDILDRSCSQSDGRHN